MFPGGSPYRSEELRDALAEVEDRHLELEGVFGLGETLASTLAGLATRICAETCAFLVDRRLDRSQGRIKELWP